MSQTVRITKKNKQQSLEKNNLVKKLKKLPNTRTDIEKNNFVEKSTKLPTQ